MWHVIVYVIYSIYWINTSKMCNSGQKKYIDTSIPYHVHVCCRRLTFHMFLSTSGVREMPVFFETGLIIGLDP